MLTLRLVMPTEADMIIQSSKAGVIDLAPAAFYDGEVAGPHVQVLTTNGTIVGRFRLKLKIDGSLKLMKGGAAASGD